MLDYGYQAQEPVDEPTSSSTNINPENTTADTTTTTTSSDSDVKYTPLVVSNIQEYVSLAVKLTHQPKLRLFHSERILARRHRLFQQDTSALLAQWKLFAHLALHNATLNNRVYDEYTQNSEMLPDLLEIPVDLAAPPPPLLAPSAPPSYRSSVKSVPVNKV